ncbi:MAG: Hsp20/alpha crystallin family protein [Flavobacteriales bacterium]|nr:Hsp20/alpha crystallin family protein [Flavobacteriales bacterium]
MALMKYRGPVDEAFPVDRLASEIFGSNIAHLLGSDGLSIHTPRVNITERTKDYRLEMEAPGFDKKDLKVDLQEDTLTIRGEHATEERKEEERYTRKEFSRASFERSFMLPNTADAAKVAADYANGVLTLTIPKREESKPKSRQISIK